MGMTDSNKKITVVIPALNEEEAIEQTIKTVPIDELRNMGYDVNVLIVDNGSTDRTAEIATGAGATVVYEPKRGYGRAYKTGFANATGDIIVTADADLTYPIEDLPRFVRILEEKDLEFITTNRLSSNNYNNKSLAFLNWIGNWGLSFVLKLFFHVKFVDSLSGMWIFKHRILDKMVLRSDGMPLTQEIKLEAYYFAKCKCEELNIDYNKRVGDTKLHMWRDGFLILFHLIRKRIVR